MSEAKQEQACANCHHPKHLLRCTTNYPQCECTDYIPAAPPAPPPESQINDVVTAALEAEGAAPDSPPAGIAHETQGYPSRSNIGTASQLGPIEPPACSCALFSDPTNPSCPVHGMPAQPTSARCSVTGNPCDRAIIARHYQELAAQPSEADVTVHMDIASVAELAEREKQVRELVLAARDAAEHYDYSDHYWLERLRKALDQFKEIA